MSDERIIPEAGSDPENPEVPETPAHLDVDQEAVVDELDVDPEAVVDELDNEPSPIDEFEEELANDDDEL